MNAIFIFILCFLGINFLVFLPNWLIRLFSKNEHQKKSFFNDTPYFILKKIAYLRFSDDSFRLIFEIQILTFLLLIFNSTYAPYFKLPLILLVMFSFIYITYITIIIKVFKKDPVFINDIQFVKTGFMVYKKKLPMLILGTILALTCVLFLSTSLIEILIDSTYLIKQKWFLIVPLFVSILLSIVSIKKINYEQYHSCVSFSLIKHLTLNLNKCRTLKKSLKTLNESFPYNYTKKIKLQKQPNIIFVFLESYGSFVFSNNKYSPEFKSKMKTMQKSLASEDIQSVSTLSESPVASGGSWLSHSSILFGAKVRDIAAHELIFSQTEYVSKLESLPKYLGSHGYNSTLATTLSYHKNEVNWEKINNAYPFDNMMLHDDFNYVGKKVNIYGDRYALPDEYTLNFAYHSLTSKSPFFLCVNTINSHYKYVSPITPKNHWKDYNTSDFELTDGLKKNDLKNYFLAIQYQLDYLHNFLLNNKDDDTIIVLIGDHQPPIITPANIDKATPIHVISKNKDLIEAFEELNFTEGLIPNQQTQKHESFFSKFLYALNKAYGENKDLEIPTFEEGIYLY